MTQLSQMEIDNLRISCLSYAKLSNADEQTMIYMLNLAGKLTIMKNELIEMEKKPAGQLQPSTT